MLKNVAVLMRDCLRRLIQWHLVRSHELVMYNYQIDIWALEAALALAFPSRKSLSCTSTQEITGLSGLLPVVGLIDIALR
jgi:hypothetical protein